MSSPRDIAVIVGSLRKESFNRKMAKAIAAMAPATLKLEIVEIGQLPLFNQDLEASPTAEVTAFKERIARADALLFVTPEYNRGVPGVLKNAIDVGSRPYGKSAWNGKPGAVISVSPGAVVRISSPPTAPTATAAARGGMPGVLGTKAIPTPARVRRMVRMILCICSAYSNTARKAGSLLNPLSRGNLRNKRSS